MSAAAAALASCWQMNAPTRSYPRPSYIYQWYTAHSQHISAMGKDGYERFGAAVTPQVTTVDPRWDVDWVDMATTEMQWENNAVET